MAITAQMVKDLREKTGAGMMDCKAALTETGGDMEAGIDWLRAKGLSKAAKKADRVAAEGLIGVAVEPKAGTVVEVNSETDFVARNELFQSMVKEIATLALKAKGDTAKLAASPMPGGKAVTDHIQEMVGKIGENMSLRRTAYLTVGDGVVASYVHNSVAPDLGKMGVLVAVESTGDKGKLMELGRQIAMHVAATNPLALTAEDIDPVVVERERAVLTEQAREQGKGKPDAVIEKMVQGRLDKFFKESVLLKQIFVIDGENTVEQAIALAEKKIGAPVKVTGFVRYALGEGIEKAESDFAAEVAAAAAG
ncbi:MULTISPECIES: translation elongation factor Ts [Rhodomicrobium]|uniref:translation elongation factor Ts n=1 Tax=Rhodomicrobium TaxID=1068 RepID=UPI000B4B7674|nr:MULTISPECIES: translation elongation factor Ts [Rhodomicrobium]